MGDDGTMTDRTPVLSQFGPQLDAVLAPHLPEVELIPVPAHGPVPAGLQGEILLTGGHHVTDNFADVLARGVRWVHALGTGIESVPLDLLGDRPFTCSRGASGVAIAEWILGVMLAFEKRLPQHWISEPPERIGGADMGALAGRTLGLVGFGGIGVETAKRALAFDMEVVACRRRAEPSPVAGVRIVPLDEVLAAADHLVLAAATTPETYHLLDERALGLVKRGVHVVNVGRGALVDQDALRVALDDGRVAMASLDTVDPEPLPLGHWLYDHPSARISAHVSSSAPWGFGPHCEMFRDNLARWQAGEPLVGLVDPVAGY
jgi:phosphoglycerate dehydrogenase-like enzyme